MSVLTHATEPHGFRLCKCAECGRVELCTPANDFYVRTGDETLALVCERCIAAPKTPTPAQELPARPGVP